MIAKIVQSFEKSKMQDGIYFNVAKWKTQKNGKR